MIAPKQAITPTTTDSPRILKMASMQQPYTIPGMMGTGTGMRVSGWPSGSPGPMDRMRSGPLPPDMQRQPSRLPAPAHFQRPPMGMMGRAGDMRMGTPRAPRLPPGHEMTMPRTDPAGFRAEAPNPIGRPAVPRG